MHGLRTPWASYTGLVDGAENDEPDRPAQGGIALLQHPDNPRYPDPVYTFSASTDFGFLATAPLMRDEFALVADESLRIRTRVLVLSSSVDAETLESAHAAFSKTSDTATVPA